MCTIFFFNLTILANLLRSCPFFRHFIMNLQVFNKIYDLLMSLFFFSYMWFIDCGVLLFLLLTLFNKLESVWRQTCAWLTYRDFCLRHWLVHFKIELSCLKVSSIISVQPLSFSICNMVVVRCVPRSGFLIEDMWPFDSIVLVLFYRPEIITMFLTYLQKHIVYWKT